MPSLPPPRPRACRRRTPALRSLLRPRPAGAGWPLAGLLLATMLFPAMAQAADDAARAEASPAEIRGREIAERAWEAGQGFGDLSAEVEMTIIARSGQEAKRAMRIQILEGEGEASRALTIVDAPRDVRGTALLTHTDENGAQQQWLYLPATSRTRRISSENRNGSFLGSEFSFDDFAAQTPSRYHFRHLGEEMLDGVECHVLHREAVDGDPGHQKVWLDTEHLRLRRVAYYDANGDITRVLTVAGHEAVADADGNRYWRATALRMENQRSGAASELRWEDIRLDSGLDPRDFEVATLERRR